MISLDIFDGTVTLIFIHSYNYAIENLKKLQNDIIETVL